MLAALFFEMLVSSCQYVRWFITSLKSTQYRCENFNCHRRLAYNVPALINKTRVCLQASVSSFASLAYWWEYLLLQFPPSNQLLWYEVCIWPPATDYVQLLWRVLASIRALIIVTNVDYLQTSVRLAENSLHLSHKDIFLNAMLWQNHYLFWKP